MSSKCVIGQFNTDTTWTYFEGFCLFPDDKSLVEDFALMGSILILGLYQN